MSQTRPIVRASRRIDIAAAVGQTAFGFPFALFDPLDIWIGVSTDGGDFVAATPTIALAIDNHLVPLG